MHHFQYVDGTLHAEGVDLKALADEIGTPFYCYSSATLERHYRVFDQAFAGQDHAVCYAMKANSNQAVIKTLFDLGAGMDVVSEGELRRARAVGVPGDKIVFSGVGKTAREMATALGEGIACLNVESVPELELLNEVAQHMGLRAPVSIRVNPDVDAKTHEKITTGKSDNKFGIPYLDAPAVYDRARAMKGIEIRGVDMHIGSQITDIAPYAKAYGLMADLIADLRARGHEIHHADLGGGLGVPYEHGNAIPPHPDEYAAVVRAALGSSGVKLYLEPGRMIVGNAGILVARVIYVKTTAAKTFFITDAGMNDIIRPTLYEAFHDIVPVTENAERARVIADVVGPVCESGDYVARNRQLPQLQQGDLIAIMTAGAYGAVQSGTYNSRPLVPEVLVKGQQTAIVRPRQTIEQLIGLDRLAPWQD
ncbi:MAG: diaminopimelate decarboxylase [Hyphomicrobiales bacterium]